MAMNPQDEQYQRDMIRLQQLEQRKADILRLQELESQKAALTNKNERSLIGGALGIPIRGLARGHAGLADLAAMPAKLLAEQTSKTLKKFPQLEENIEEIEPNYSQFTELSETA